MIYDKVENMSLYFKDRKNFDKVEKAYKDFCLNPFKEGSREIDGDNVFYSSCYYEPKDTPQKKYEAHRAYADVQIVFDGEENIGYANLEDLKVTEDFKENGDICFGRVEQGQILSLKKGYFMVLFPQDAHAPGIKSNNSNFSHKLVFKVKL